MSIITNKMVSFFCILKILKNVKEVINKIFSNTLNKLEVFLLEHFSL
jgi:hypothetical protein